MKLLLTKPSYLFALPRFLSFALLLSFSFFIRCTSVEQSAEVAPPLSDSTAWPNAVTYEIFVQSFYDSDGDGIGDISGMTTKLGYLDSLGVEAVWLMPIHPSPSYHKYDVTDYRDVHPDYGTLDDFRNFTQEAHAHGIKIVIDLVVNHSSSEHPWFIEASKGPDNPYRDYYVWADEAEIKDEIEKEETRLDSDNITQWHQAEGNDELYYAYFIGGMPDLNYDNPKVKQEIFDIGRFWLEDVGIDGFRLDAARHIFPDDRPTDNHAWWVEFRAEMEAIKPDVYLVGEVWADAETVAPYMKGLHALFNFDLGYAITRTVQQGVDTGLVQTHKKILDFYQSVRPDFINAIFLTNHDQNRIMSELGGDIGKGKVAASLLMTLPGAPYIYYGEEIGMLGQKPDPNIREPFLWRANDPGIPTWMEAEYTTPATVTPLDKQMSDPNSLYNHYRKLIAFRKDSPVLTFGAIDTTDYQTPGLSSFYRSYAGDTLLVLHNLTDQTLDVPGRSAYSRAVFSTRPGGEPTAETISLPPYGTYVLAND